MNFKHLNSMLLYRYTIFLVFDNDTDVDTRPHQGDGDGKVVSLVSFLSLLLALQIDVFIVRPYS